MDGHPYDHGNPSFVKRYTLRYANTLSAMLNRFFSALLAGLLVFGAVATAQAQDRAGAIRQMLEQRDRQIKTLLGNRSTFTDKQREELKRVINDNIDFEAMGRQALGPHWDGLSAAQRKEFVDVFSEIVRNQSLSNLDVYRAQVTYGKIDVKGETANVSTTTVYKDVPTKVDYVLAQKGDQWRVQDIVLDGVSTAEGYARSFQSVVRKRGFDALMTSLRKKLDQTSS